MDFTVIIENMDDKTEADDLVKYISTSFPSTPWVKVFSHINENNESLYDVILDGIKTREFLAGIDMYSTDYFRLVERMRNSAKSYVAGYTDGFVEGHDSAY